jgi:hypothetical protein
MEHQSKYNILYSNVPYKYVKLTNDINTIYKNKPTKDSGTKNFLKNMNSLDVYISWRKKKQG